MGIPNAVVTAFTSIAFNVGANRIVFGGDFTAPSGDPSLPPDREKVFRHRILEKALFALEAGTKEPVIYTVDEGKEG